MSALDLEILLALKRIAAFKLDLPVLTMCP